MQSIQLNIIGQSVQLVKRSADELSGLNMGEKLSLDFYNGNFRDTNLLFVKPKEPTPRLGNAQSFPNDCHSCSRCPLSLSLLPQ